MGPGLYDADNGLKKFCYERAPATGMHKGTRVGFAESEAKKKAIVPPANTYFKKDCGFNDKKVYTRHVAKRH